MSKYNFEKIRYTKVEGYFFRAISKKLFKGLRKKEKENRLLSMEGSLQYGGRYNLKSDFGILYTSESEQVCIAERKRAGLSPKSQMIGKLKVSIEKVLDLTSHETRQLLGLSEEDLTQDDYTLTQEIGSSARQAGYEAIMVSSATRNGRNLAIFVDRLSSKSSVVVVEVKTINFK